MHHDGNLFHLWKSLLWLSGCLSATGSKRRLVALGVLALPRTGKRSGLFAELELSFLKNVCSHSHVSIIIKCVIKYMSHFDTIDIKLSLRCPASQ